MKGRERINDTGDLKNGAYYQRTVSYTHLNFTLEEYLAYLKQFPYDGNHLFIDLHGKRYEIFTVQALSLIHI